MHERDRRAKKEILKNVLRFMTKEKARHERNRKILLRTSRVTSFFLLFLSLALIVDCKILAPKKVVDRVKKLDLVTHKRSMDIYLYTNQGKWFSVSNTGYEQSGDTITYLETPVFKITDKIILLKNKLPIERKFNAIRLAPHFSIVCLLLSLLFLWLNPKHSVKEAVGTLIIAVFIVETVLLLI